jgi:short chain dehydrogenase
MPHAWTTDDIPDQSGRSVVVTGSNAGLGYHTALALGAAGAHVVLACRNLAKAELAVADIRRYQPPAFPHGYWTLPTWRPCAPLPTSSPQNTIDSIC